MKTMIIKVNELDVAQFAGLAQFLASDDNFIVHQESGTMFNTGNEGGSICARVTFARIVSIKETQVTACLTQSDVVLEVVRELGISGRPLTYDVPISYLTSVMYAMSVMAAGV